MFWHSYDEKQEGGYFRCRIKARAGLQRRRAAHLERGLCIRCNQPLVTETLCADHADRHADLMAQPKQALGHYLADMRHRNRRREMKPVGVFDGEV